MTNFILRVVDTVALRELQDLVVRAVDADDASLLVDFYDSRRAAQARLDDVEQTLVEPETLERAVAALRSLEGHPAGETPEGALLLQSARAMSTRGRYVAANALNALMFRATSIEKLVGLEAPEELIISVVERTAAALAALDAFNFEVSQLQHGVYDPEMHGPIANACLGLMRLPGLDSDCIENAPRTESLVERAVFESPSNPAKRAAFERLCVNPDGHPPARVACGHEFVAMALQMEAFWESLKAGQQTPTSRRAAKMVVRCLERVQLASQRGHSVVEWVVPNRFLEAVGDQASALS